MKKLIITLAVLVLAGCDNQPERKIPEKPSIASMIASGTEEKTTNCSNGSVTSSCEFLSGDLLSSGKWHHAKVYISNTGDVDITVDGERFYKVDSDSGFYEGRNTITVTLKGLNKSSAEVSITNSNSGSRLSIDVYNKDGKKFMMASK
ncbi:hypothetical protein [Yersinia intermedia]|uniref:hypothetical protein n=1 Tax=Yersinia intermedia TaxID=631 RepID=UPI001CFDA0E1|nr:hypothetical protein [Yersinia intermedia]MCB5315765.1 hypothetical protein [Yersinia intermedia]MCB5329427.1 hypothetical protein [Yersinia intermedia]